MTTSTRIDQMAAYMRFAGSPMSHDEIRSDLGGKPGRMSVADLRHRFGIPSSHGFAMTEQADALQDVAPIDQYRDLLTFDGRDLDAWLQHPAGRAFWSEYQAALASESEVPGSPMLEMAVSYLQEHGSPLSDHEIRCKLTDSSGGLRNVTARELVDVFGIARDRVSEALGEPHTGDPGRENRWWIFRSWDHVDAFTPSDLMDWSGAQARGRSSQRQPVSPAAALAPSSQAGVCLRSCSLPSLSAARPE